MDIEWETVTLPEEDDNDNDYQKNKGTQSPDSHDGSNFHASVVLEGRRPIYVVNEFLISFCPKFLPPHRSILLIHSGPIF